MRTEGVAEGAEDHQPSQSPAGTSLMISMSNDAQAKKLADQLTITRKIAESKSSLALDFQTRTVHE